MTLFETDIMVTDPLYTEYRDAPEREAERKYLEELWKIFKEYADPFFKKNLKRDFLAGYWEMILGCFLIRNSFKLLPNSGIGPDFRIDNSPLIAIEAVAPGPGDGLDAVPSIKKITGSRSVGAMPNDQIELRIIRNGILKKLQKYNKNRFEGIVTSDECYIIAINTLKLGLVSIETDPPHLLRATLGMGNPVGLLRREKKQNNVELEYTYHPVIYKKNLSEVKKDIFLNPDYSGISAILMSFVKPQHRKIKPDIKLLHNPYAHNPLPMNFLPNATEYWIEDDYLLCRFPVS